MEQTQKLHHKEFTTQAPTHLTYKYTNLKTPFRCLPHSYHQITLQGGKHKKLNISHTHVATTP